MRTFFSANNVYFIKNTNIFSKKKFFFQLSFATNEQTYSQMFFKTDVLKKFVIFAGKHLCWTLVLMKLQLYQKEYWWLICREKSFILKK